jgi:succinate-semialdehyde dehydrogenase/glutarate-semialdehyde dehydrogenase
MVFSDVGAPKMWLARMYPCYEPNTEWSKLTAEERGNYLRKVYQLMVENKEKLAEIMTIEMGKPLEDSLGEVHYAASFLEWFAEEGKRVYGRIVPGRRESHRIQVIKRPVGVVAAITPWNFPAAMITRKMGPALASGCTFTVKPATKNPYTAIKIMEYCEQAGIPKGVVNLITGSSGEISETFMNDQRVRKVTFTGSTQVGKILIKQSAEQVKKLSLELGGHAPLIILDDADLTKAVKGTMASKFRNGGQTCIAANRIYVQEKVYDTFVETFSEAVSKLNVGNGLEENIDIGPIIDQGGYEKVDKQVKDAVAKGAEIVTGGKGWNDGESFFINQQSLKMSHHIC